MDVGPAKVDERGFTSFLGRSAFPAGITFRSKLENMQIAEALAWYNLFILIP